MQDNTFIGLYDLQPEAGGAIIGNHTLLSPAMTHYSVLSIRGSNEFYTRRSYKNMDIPMSYLFLCFSLPANVLVFD